MLWGPHKPRSAVTGKEWDEATGLYYCGARYLDPRTSRWASADAALVSYVPVPGGDPAALPGLGGVSRR
jgi:RHS repeat-associated protein